MIKETYNKFKAIIKGVSDDTTKDLLLNLQKSLEYCMEENSVLREVLRDDFLDGEAYHLNKYGERKQDDVYRDLQVQSCGWIVLRFWYRDVQDNINECIKQIKKSASSCRSTSES